VSQSRVEAASTSVCRSIFLGGDAGGKTVGGRRKGGGASWLC
jgi:hypothetical protein